MLFEDITILDENFRCQEHKWVGIQGNKINYIGDRAPENPADFSKRYDGTNKLLMPSLVNTHTHAPMTLLRGFAENLPLKAWLETKCWPFEAKMTPEDNYWACLLAGAEMLRFGTTSFSDMYYHTSHRARAIKELGMKANLCTTPICFEPKPIEEYEIFEEMEDSMTNINNTEDGRILFEACVHAEYTNNDISAKSVFEWARAHNTHLQVHVSETKAEVADCRERHDGKSPVEWLESLGAFEVRTTAAHCVWVDEKDMEILSKNKVTVAHNPASNLKLASGFAPVKKMLEAGVNVAMGTDGMASNNNHDMFKETYLMALLPKGNTYDPTAITPQEALYAATRAGAIAQGRDDCGLIKEGFRADICVLDMNGPSWCPNINIPTNIVYAGSGSDVVLTMCDGAVLYEDGQWPGLDMARIKEEVVQRTERIQHDLEAE